MAHDRYTCICKPLTSYLWTYNKATAGIFIAWLCAGLISSPQLFLFSLTDVKIQNTSVTTCYVDWSSKRTEIAYVSYHVISQFITPLLLLLFFYTNIFKTVSHNIRRKNISIKNDLLLDNCMECDSKCLISNRKSYLLEKSSKVSRFFSYFKTQAYMNFCCLSDDQALVKRTIAVSNKSFSEFDKVLMPIRQNRSAQMLSKSKMKTLRLTFIVVTFYLICSLPFYSSTFINVMIASDNYAHSHGKFIRKYNKHVIFLLSWGSISCFSSSY